MTTNRKWASLPVQQRSKDKNIFLSTLVDGYSWVSNMSFVENVNDYDGMLLAEAHRKYLGVKHYRYVTLALLTTVAATRGNILATGCLSHHYLPEFTVCCAHFHRTMADRRTHKTYRTTEEILEQLFALPSDDESVDGMEDSDDDICDDTGTSEKTPSSGNVSDSVESDDDDDILYQLADPDADFDWSDADLSNTDQQSSDSSTDDEEIEWQKNAFVESGVDFDNVTVVPQQPFLHEDGAVEFFQKFCTQEVIHLLVEQTNLYAQQNNTQHWENTTDDEIRSFIGLLIAMGLHGLPAFRLFWSTDPLFRVQPVADVMTRQRFMKLLGNLHINDNSTAAPRGDPQYDRLHKIRPLLTEMNKHFQTEAVSSSSQSIDEAMIRFKGRSAIRQYMPMKPTKRGFKVWVRADAKTGYIYQFDLYTGKEGDSRSGRGLGPRVVKHLTESLKNTNTHVTFDNFFTSVQLMEDLHENKIFATGTVRSDRLQLPTLAKVKTPMERGVSKWLTRNNIGYVKWMDTKAVHVVSTAFSPSEKLQAQRTQKDGTSLTVTCPRSIVEYTKRMGGVDRFDRIRSHYSVSRKSKRWWLRILYFIIDASVVNAFILHASIQPDKKLTMQQFRVHLFRGLVRGFSSRQRRSASQGTLFMRYRFTGKSRKKLMGVPDDIRLQPSNHFPEKTDSFHRCRLCSSRKNNKRSRIMCTQCKVWLCINPCFGRFHR